MPKGHPRSASYAFVLPWIALWAACGTERQTPSVPDAGGMIAPDDAGDGADLPDADTPDEPHADATVPPEDDAGADAGSPPTECAEGHVETEACGLNGRGAARRTCLDGAWHAWSACEDPDLCTDGALHTQTCGRNGRGHVVDTCSEGHWLDGTCADPDVCEDGTSESQACGPAGAGSEHRMCASGQWGVWSPCDVVSVCEEGATDARACGFNDRGRETWRCEGNAWILDEACVDPDQCLDGTQEPRACGLNGRGLETRTCQSGQFGAYGPCQDVDVCLDDTLASQACGLNDQGTQSRRCDLGQFGAWGACVDPDVCVNGAMSSQACGANGRGTQVRTCDEGQWGAFGICEDVDMCRDGAIETEACGTNGRGQRSRVCATGRWGDFGVCADADVCVDAATEQRACGLNGRGSESRACVLGQWSAFGTCNDPDVCVFDATEPASCGLNDRGLGQRVCWGGQWSGVVQCVDPDECVDGAHSEGQCGLESRGRRSIDCVAGRWVIGPCSQICGDGTVQAPEVCDDGNDASGDGCSSHCVPEDLEFVRRAPELFEEYADGDIMADGGFLALGRAWTSATLTDLFVASLDGQGVERTRLNFGVSGENPWVDAYPTHDRERDRMLIHGPLHGEISALGLASTDHWQQYVASIDADGDVRYAYVLEADAPVQPNQPFTRLSPNGDVTLYGHLALGDDLRIEGAIVASARNLDPMWKSARYVVRLDAEGGVLFSGTLLSDAANAVAGPSDADDTRTLLVAHGTAHVAWRTSQAELVAGPSALFVLERDGMLSLQYESNVTSADALPAGELAVTMNDGERRTRILDAAGQVRFESVGDWFKSRADGAYLLRAWFENELVLAEGTADQRTLGTPTSGPAVALAAFGADGELLDARVLQSGGYAAEWDATVDDGMLFLTECSAGCVLGEGGSASVVAADTVAECVSRYDEQGDLLWHHCFTGFVPSTRLYSDGEQVWGITPPNQRDIDRGFGTGYAFSHWNASGELVHSEPLASRTDGFYGITRVRDGRAWMVAGTTWPFDTILPDDPLGNLSVGPQRSVLVKFRR